MAREIQPDTLTLNAGAVASAGSDQSVTIILPWPPSVNSYWRSIPMYCHKRRRCISRVLISAKGRAYRSEVQSLIALSGVVRHRPPLSGNLGCKIWFAPPDNRGRDIDNYKKAIFDALTHSGVWGDDSQVKDDRSIWCKKTPHGRVVIKINQLSGGVKSIYDLCKIF